MKPLVEQCRPRTLSDVVGQPRIVAALQRMVEVGDFPHLLFSGPRGVGKTTCAEALVRDMVEKYSPGDNWRLCLLELNASDDRGIGVIREKVKPFTRQSKHGGMPFNVVFLDEADALTFDAQPALRRIMEEFSGGCRFILACNNLSKIMDPIQDRCLAFRFAPVGAEEVLGFLRAMVEREGLEVEEAALEAIAKGSRGSVRRAVTFLQAVAAGVDVKTVVDEGELAKAALAVLRFSLQGEFGKAEEAWYHAFYSGGYSVSDLMEAVADAIDGNETIPPGAKATLIREVAYTSRDVALGAPPQLQLRALMRALHLAVAKMAGGN